LYQAEKKKKKRGNLWGVKKRDDDIRDDKQKGNAKGYNARFLVGRGLLQQNQKTGEERARREK